MKSFRQYINEKNNRGIKYEADVKRVMRNATKGRPTQVTRAKGGGSFSAHDNDMVLRVNKKEYPVEIKADSRSQMGGISINYNYKTKELSIPNNKVDLDDETIELIRESVEEKRKDLDKVIEWFQKNDGVFEHNKNPGFPLRVSQDAWKTAINKGVIKELNQMIKNNTQFIASYYKTKGVHYIQIGGAGLFYLSSNPLKLDIPKLQGQITLEFRAGKSGVKYNKTHDYEYSTVVLRLQGRLSFKGKSGMTIDTAEGAKKFLDSVES